MSWELFAIIKKKKKQRKNKTQKVLLIVSSSQGLLMPAIIVYPLSVHIACTLHRQIWLVSHSSIANLKCAFHLCFEAVIHESNFDKPKKMELLFLDLTTSKENMYRDKKEDK